MKVIVEEVILMRKIGSISSALGLIFLGAWMIIRRTNEGLAIEIFKWWPVIFIILGFEILFSFNKRDENQRVRINGFIIPVIICFLLVNGFNEVNLKLGNGIQWLGKSQNLEAVLDQFINIEDSNYKLISTTKVLNMEGKEFIFQTDNADVTIKNSVDGKITLDASVYVKKGSEMDKYDIIEEKQADGYKVEINNGDIRKVKINIYIPSTLNFTFKGNNCKVKSEDNRTTSSFDIDTNNGSIYLSNGLFAKIKTNNGKIDIKDIQKVDIDSSNGSIDLEGKISNMNVVSNNAMIEVDNDICENINIKSNSGTVKFKTDDNNVDINLVMNHGTCKVNDERRINAGISKVFGQGKGKVIIELNNGVINFDN
jgi:hypothetical protein